MHTKARPIYGVLLPHILHLLYLGGSRWWGELVRTNIALENPPENGRRTQYSFNSAEMIDFVEIQSDRAGFC
jgi:hypothetical protein